MFDLYINKNDKKEIDEVCNSSEEKEIENEKLFEPQLDLSLSDIRLGTPYEYMDVRMLCEKICTVDSLRVNNRHDYYWVRASISLLTGIVLHLLYLGKQFHAQPTLCDVFKFVSDCDVINYDFHTWVDIIFTEHDLDFERWKDSKGEPTLTHPVVYRTVNAFMHKPDKEAGGIYSTLLHYLEIYYDPNETSEFYSLLGVQRRKAAEELRLKKIEEDKKKKELNGDIEIETITKRYTSTFVSDDCDNGGRQRISPYEEEEATESTLIPDVDDVLSQN